METFARQTILPPPPSVSRSLVAFVYAHRARILGLVREAMHRLARTLRSPPALPASLSLLPSSPDWTAPKLTAMLATLRAEDSSPTPAYRPASATRLRQSAATAVELRRAG